MRILTIVVAAIILASCGARPLRTTEEATADAVLDAAANADAIVASAEVKAAEVQTTITEAEVQELTVLVDTLTGCEYVSNGSGLSPRTAFAYKTGAGTYGYKHLGCNEG